MISLSLGWITLFLIGTDLFVVSPLLPTIGDALGVSVSEMGWMVTVFALAYVIGGPSLGSLADRRGRRVVLTASLALFAVANGLTAVAPSFVVLLVGRAVAGLAASGVTPSVYGMIGTGAPEGRRATWLSIVTSGLLLALATGAPAGSLLSTAVGWRGVFWVLCVLAAVVLAVSLLSARRAPQPRPAAVSRGQPAGLLERVRAVSVTGLWALAVYGVYTFLGAGLRQSAGFDSGLVALALVLYGAGAVVGNLSGGPLADRFGGLRVTTLSLVSLALVEALVGLLVHERVVLLVGLGAFALAAYPYFSAHQTRLVERYGDQAAALMAWNNTAMYVGILIASAVGGLVLAHASFGALFGAAAAVALLGALATRVAIARPGR